MDEAERLDARFRQAVSAIDAGDLESLDRLLAAHPELARDRLLEPGPWLRDAVGTALDDFFNRPYLLWFVAEDPVRNGKLPPNVADAARSIIQAARRGGVENLDEQLDPALRLVCWSWIARESGVQIALIDVLLDAGASIEGSADQALVNGNFDAARHLVERGAPLTLATAACLGRWDDVDRLAATASDGDRRLALVLAALHGQAPAVRALLDRGADPNGTCPSLYPHGTVLHHAVGSGSLEAVQALVEAGAALDVRDTAWHGTPRDWAEHYRRELLADARAARYAAISDYLARHEGRR